MGDFIMSGKWKADWKSIGICIVILLLGVCVVYTMLQLKGENHNQHNNSQDLFGGGKS